MKRFQTGLFCLLMATAAGSACSSSGDDGGGRGGSSATAAAASRTGGSSSTGGQTGHGWPARHRRPNEPGHRRATARQRAAGTGGRRNRDGLAAGPPGSRGAGERAPAGSATGGAAGSATGGSGGATSAYNPCPTSGSPCKILPLGDWITFGINYEGSYRVEPIKKAITANQNITYVGTQQNGPETVPGTSVAFPKNHEGWSGYTINMILAKAAGDVQAAPNIILLHAGTNDTYMSDPTGAPMRLSSAVDSLATMFPNTLIVVAKIIPYPSQMTNVNLINNSIPAMVQAKQAAGKHVIMGGPEHRVQRVGTMLSSDSYPSQTRPATTGWATPGTRSSGRCSRRSSGRLVAAGARRSSLICVRRTLSPALFAPPTSLGRHSWRRRAGASSR